VQQHRTWCAYFQAAPRFGATSWEKIGNPGGGWSKTGMFRVAVLCLSCVFACAGTRELPQRAVELNALGALALAEGDLEAADARLSLALEYSPEFVRR
jgi:hypothetical protein